VGIDRPDDADAADVPRDKHSNHSADRVPPETRYRQECYDDLRGAAAIQERTEPAGRSEPGARSKPGEQTEPAAPTKPREQTENGHQSQQGTSWEAKAEQFRWMWSEYKRRWPPEERTPMDNANDPQGSSIERSASSADSTVNDELEAECQQIADRERRTISPRLREVDNCDPDRHLVGFEFRLKGRDRIEEKVAKSMDENSLSQKEAIASVPDAIRFTFRYDDETRYADGVRADIVRMKEQGFELSILKNSWSSDQYKGINSQWIEPESGQRFELQFHTRISFEAKQITHKAYERIRAEKPDPFEHMVLEAFQAKVTAAVPIPPGADEIPDYLQRDQNGR
jgi:hypothetical protein